MITLPTNVAYRNSGFCSYNLSSFFDSFQRYPAEQDNAYSFSRSLELFLLLHYRVTTISPYIVWSIILYTVAIPLPTHITLPVSRLVSSQLKIHTTDNGDNIVALIAFNARGHLQLIFFQADKTSFTCRNSFVMCS